MRPDWRSTTRFLLLQSSQKLNISKKLAKKFNIMLIRKTTRENLFKNKDRNEEHVGNIEAKYATLLSNFQKQRKYERFNDDFLRENKRKFFE